VSLRSRILLASVLLVIAPLAVLAVGVRHEMARRLTEQYERRVATLAAVIEDDLTRLGDGLGVRLDALSTEIASDNRFRLAAVVGQAEQRSYLLDFAAREMRLLGLSMLQIQDEDGRILSSGHFRNEFDRMEPALPRLLATVPSTPSIDPTHPKPLQVYGCALIRARRPEGPFLALARVDSALVGRRRFSLVGGIEMDSTVLAGLSRDVDLTVTLDVADGNDPVSAARNASLGLEVRGDPIIRTIGLSLVADDPSEPRARHDARVIVSHSRAPLRDILRRLDRWLALLLAATAAGTLALAVWLSVRISRPLDALARKAARIDLDHLDIDFASGRADEVGVLSRFLAEMTARLRRSAESLREAERRATLGDMARQVNHDVRNAMTPIRNVVRHLGQVVRDSPERLGGVFLERETTIESSLAYLEALAANYARLSPRIAREPLDVNAIAREVTGAAGGDATIRLELADGIPPVLADRVGLRRVVENLVRNARESLAGGAGVVTVTTDLAADADGGRVVRVRVQDTGRGMSAEERGRIFDHFYTTKVEGTGLGLSIVKRLVSDFEGTLSVESAPGRGTTVTVTLPAAPTPEPRADPEESTS